MVALVSECDYENISQYKWHAAWEISAKSFIAVKKVRLRDGKCTKVSMHRFIFDFPKGLHIDHANHCTLDNRRSNIRLATPSQNQFNRGRRCDNSSGYKGVSEEQGRFRAAIKINRKKIHLGSFPTAKAAHAAYCKAAHLMHGDFVKVA
jgi:hypothetical protein